MAVGVRLVQGVFSNHLGVSMFRVVSSRVFGVITILGLTASGCQSDLRQFSGDYIGQIGLQYSSEPVSEVKVEVRASSEDANHLLLSGQVRGEYAEWRVQKGPAIDELTLNASGPVSYSGHLHKKTGANCFESAGIHLHSHAKLCFSGQQAELDVSEGSTRMTLSLERKGAAPVAGNQPILEDPANFTLVQLRDRARTKSFSSREEFEKLVGAKLNTRLRYLNLLPHISANSAIAIGTFSGIPSLLSSIGDLAPFLLPSRWIEARESKNLLTAQKVSVEIMQLDAMQIVEGMCLLVGRDNLLHTQLKTDRAQQAEIIQAVTALEQAGKLPPGSVLEVQSDTNALDQTISNLESQIQLEMTDLAQAAGFTNPNAILSVAVEPFGNINQAPAMDLSKMEKAVIQVAPELEQMKSLLDAAKLDKVDRGFQWLDPTGDPAGGLGAGLPTYIQIAANNLDQLLTSRDELNSTLLKKVTDAYNDYTGWIDSYNLAADGIGIQQKRIDLARKTLQSLSVEASSGNTASSEPGNVIADLRDALEQLPANHANLTTAEYAWYVSISRINRLLREGPYQGESSAEERLSL